MNRVSSGIRKGFGQKNSWRQRDEVYPSGQTRRCWREELKVSEGPLCGIKGGYSRRFVPDENQEVTRILDESEVARRKRKSHLIGRGRCSTFRKAESRFGNSNVKPAAKSRQGMTRWLPSRSSLAISPRTARRTNAGTGSSAGRFKTCARVRVKSAFVAGFGATVLIAPRSS